MPYSAVSHDRHTAAALAAVAREALESDALKQWEDVLDGNDLLSIAARVTARPSTCTQPTIN